MLKQLLAGVTGLAAAGAVALATTGAASATTPTTPVECPTWTLRSVVNDWGPAADGSTVVDANTVILTKPVGGGTEFAAMNLNMTFDSPVTIEVDYQLSDGADHAAGAVRLFYYEANSPDTSATGTAPTAFIPATSGTGTLTIAGVDKLGTVGLVYDASNAAGGKVTFENLKVGGKLLAFKDVCVEASTSATATASPTVTATASATATPSATKTATPAPATSVSTSPVASLPVTGSSSKPALIAGIALVVVAGGTLLFLAARRRRTRFEA